MFIARLITVLWLVTCEHVKCTDTFPWLPPWMPDRTDLSCSNICKEYEDFDETSWDNNRLHKCCTCRSTAAWEKDESIKDMFIEFTTVIGASVAITTDDVTNTSHYRLLYEDSVMTSLPVNLCHVEKLMQIDLSGNRITSLEGIECAYKLDMFDLSYNRITVIKKSSLEQLRNLRLVDLSHNKIVSMEPNIFTNINARFFWFDLSYNVLDSIDVTNILGEYPFCKVSYQNNQIKELVNVNNFQLDLNITYGPGFVDLKNNQIETFPNFKKIFRLDSLAVIGKILEFGLDFRGCPLKCDCNLVRFLELAEKIIKTVWQSYHDVLCTAPDQHEGKKVIEVPLSELVCNLGVEDDCPIGCHCVDEPYKNVITIECVDVLLEKLPDKLPTSAFSDFIDLNVASNHITEINNDLEYLDSIHTLNISNNSVREVSEEVAASLQNASQIVLEGNNLKTLPRGFIFKSPCDLQLEGIVLDCDCGMAWLENWLSIKNCKNMSKFYCNVDGKGIIDARDFRKDMLKCFDNYEEMIIKWMVGLSAALCVVIITATLAFVFRYEMVIMYVRLFTQYMQDKQDRMGLANIKRHAFFSYSEEDKEVEKWVFKIGRHLGRKGYNMCIPCQDIIVGSRDDETIMEINQSACVIVVLSDSYASNLSTSGETETDGRTWTMNEWKYAWNRFTSNPSKRLIVVNFDHVLPEEVTDRRIKAYLRVGRLIDFTNGKRDIVSTIEAELGIFVDQKEKKDRIQSKPKLNSNLLRYFMENKETWCQGNVNLDNDRSTVVRETYFLGAVPYRMRKPSKVYPLFTDNECQQSTFLSETKQETVPNIIR